MHLKKRLHHNSKGTPSHLSQLERNPESPTASQEEPYAITRKEPPGTKLGACPPATPPKLERIPLQKLDRSSPAHCT